MNDMGHFSHNSTECDSVRLSFGAFPKKESLEHVFMKDRNRGSIEEPRAQEFVASLGDVSLPMDARAALMDTGIKP